MSRKRKYNKEIKLLIVLFSALLLALFGTSFESILESQEPKLTARLKEVVDGDTLKVHLGGKVQTVRLIGIDTPETSANERAKRVSKKKNTGLKTHLHYGKLAKQFVEKLVPSDSPLTIELGEQPRDKYGRLLGYIYLRDGRMLNEEILRSGYAYIYTFDSNAKYTRRFRAAFKEARENERGLFKGNN